MQINSIQTVSIQKKQTQAQTNFKGLSIRDYSNTEVINFFNPELIPKLRKLLNAHPPMGVSEMLPDSKGKFSWEAYFLDGTQKNLKGFQKAVKAMRKDPQYQSGALYLDSKR